MLTYRLICAVILVSIVLFPSSNAQKDKFIDLTDLYSSPQSPGSPLLWDRSETGHSLTLTYVANMGVIVNSGDWKVMIDCLFDGPTGGRFPAPETLDSIINGIPPFDDIDLVLVTHKDRDHFDSAVAVQYLEARPEPILVVPADAAEKMRLTGSGWSNIESRVIIIDLKVGEKLRTNVASIPITVFSTTHGNTAWPMNLMYLIEINGWRVFHEGDASGKADDYLAFGLDTVEIGLSVMQYSWPFHAHRPYRLFFQDVFKSDHIALAHIKIKEESVAEDKIDKVRKYYKDIFPLLPGMPNRIFRK